jgi:hypothetical protein
MRKENIYQIQALGKIFPPTSSTTGFTIRRFDASDTANEPSAGNPFVTKMSLQFIYQRNHTAANIL